MVDFHPHERPAHSAAELPQTPPARLIGREGELQQVYPVLKESRAVFVHGAEGMGKTALGLTLASAMSQQPGGVLWLSVDADTTLEALLVRVGRAYNVGDIALTDNPLGMVGAVAELLQRHKPLVVLDGSLDVVTAAKFVTRCADRVPTLILDRNVQAGPWVTVELGALSTDNAVALFRQEANLSSADADADIRAICKLLNNQPYALCVLARTLLANKLQPAQIANSLKQAAAGAKDDPNRMALTVSFTALNSALQGVILMLGAMHTGGGSLDLLHLVTGAPVDSLQQALTGLARLRLVEAGQRGGKPYFRLHSVMRRFCVERLQTMGRLDTLRDKVRESLVSFAQDLSAGGAASHDRLSAEIENFVALAREANAKGNRDLSNKLVSALTGTDGFVDGRGYRYELSLMRGVGAAAFPAYVEPASPEDMLDDEDLDDEDEDFDDEDDDLSEDSAAAEALFDSIAGGSVEESVSSAVAEAVARGTLDDDDDEDDEEDEDDDLDDDDEDDDLPEDSGILDAIGHTEPVTVEARIVALRTALGQARQDRDLGRQTTTLRQLGNLEMEQGMLIEAIATYNEALDVYERREDQAGQLEILEILAALTEKTENAQASVLHATRGIKLAEALGDDETQLQLLITLGDARQQLGESAEAVRVYGQALALARNTDDATHEALILYKLGYAQLDSGDPDRAVDTWEQGLALFKAQNKRDFEGRTKGALGSAYAELQRWQEAISFHKSALFIARDLGDKREEAVQLSNLGYTSQQAGVLGEAVTHYRQALHLAYESNDRADIVSTIVDLARLLMKGASLLKVTQALVEDGLRLDPTDKDLRQLRDRIATEITAAEARGVAFKPVTGTAREYAEAAYE